jgi:hypothetical protein
VTAIRVANVPEESFRADRERRPAERTALADQGKQSMTPSRKAG